MTMTTPTIPFDAARFLKHMQGVSFSSVGVFMLIRSHMLLTPDHCMTREGIHAALRTRTPFAIELVASVIDTMFETDTDGTIYSPGLDARVQSVEVAILDSMVTPVPKPMPLAYRKTL